MIARTTRLLLVTTTGIVIASLLADEVGAQTITAHDSVLVRMYGSYAPYIRSLAEGILQLAIVCLIALPFQVLFPAMRRRPKIRSYEFWLDIIYSFQSVWLTFIYFYVAVYWVVDTVYGADGPWLPALAQLPAWIQVVLAVWAFDFATYWRHRWEHTFSVLWSFHAVHHTSEKIDVLSATRLHPFEVALAIFFQAAVVKIGLSPIAATLGLSIYLFYSYFIHANVRIRFSGFPKYIFVSPFMHHWHHAKSPTGKNVGAIFAWNDWIFRTAYHPDHWPPDYGLDVPPAERVGQSYLRHLVYPVQYLIARVTAWRAARAIQATPPT